MKANYVSREVLIRDCVLDSVKFVYVIERWLEIAYIIETQVQI